MQIKEKTRERQIQAPARRSLDEAHGLYRIGIAYGGRLYRLRWFIIAAWVVILGASIPFTLKVGDALHGSGYSYDNSESAKVDTIISNTLKQPPSQFLVVFQSDSTPVSDPAYRGEVNAFINRARVYPQVTAIQQSGAGLDGRTIYVTVSLSTPADYMSKHVDDFRAILPSGSAASPAHVYLSGGPAIDAAFSHITESDVQQAELAALPIALVVLLIVFGTLVAATMPLLLAILAVPVSLAVIYAIALHVSMSIFVLNTSSIIGLGISIDYSLFMLRRFRDELASCGSVPDAVGNTIATSGEAILFSGLIVMIGFAGLLLIGIPFMTSIGIGGAVVVAVAVLAALTLLPALLSVLGPRVNTLRIPLIGRFTAPHDTKKRPSVLAGELPVGAGVEWSGAGTLGSPSLHAEETTVGAGTLGSPSLARKDVDLKKHAPERGGFWQRWAEEVMRRPVLVILVVTAILIGLGWPIFSIELGTPSVTSLPTSDESRHGIDIVNAQFPDTRIDPVYIIARAPGASSILTSPADLAKLDNLSKWIARQPHVTGVISLTQLPASPGTPALSEQQLAALYSSGAYRQYPAITQLVTSTTSGNTTLITVLTNAQLDSSDGNALINNLRAGDTQAGQGLTVLVGGSQASDLDFNSYLYGNFPRSIIFILVATYLLLLLMFRSVFLPLKAILMNVLSVAACYGLLVFVFQWGHFSNILSFTPNGFLDSTNPILLFCILFGLSMDYEVFLLSRIHEEWLRTHNNRYAVARGLEKTGGVITNAALLFVIVTGAFTFTSLLITKEIGLGMSIAVLLDATVIRTLLVPATMRLLGRWNWWLPGRPLPPKQAEGILNGNP